MNLKQLINKSTYGTIGYISSLEDLDLLESYIVYNLPVLKEFKQVIIATNYLNDLQNENTQLWKKHLPNCIVLDSKTNRGHNFGTADLDNLVFDYCKDNNIKWLCKSSNDVILTKDVLNINIEEKDFYYLNGISYEDLHLNSFDSEKIYNNHFYPQTNLYLIDVSKCDYLNNHKYLDETYHYSKTIPNYNGKIWEYIQGWSCENFLKECVKRNNLTKHYLLDVFQHNKLCKTIELYQIGDPSHKNIMVEGICHFQYSNQNILEI
jgi:hypothetical protein